MESNSHHTPCWLGRKRYEDYSNGRRGEGKTRGMEDVKKGMRGERKTRGMEDTRNGRRGNGRRGNGRRGEWGQTIEEREKEGKKIRL